VRFRCPATTLRSAERRSECEQDEDQSNHELSPCILAALMWGGWSRGDGWDRPRRTRFGGEGGRRTWYAVVIVTWRHCDDLEGRDLLHAGRAGCRYGFAALNHGLEAMAKEASLSTREQVQRQVELRVL